MEKILKLLGKRIQIIRKKRGLTLEKLSEKANITPNHLKKIESARTAPSFKSMCDIAESLNISLKDLFNFDELQCENFIKNEFEKIIKVSDEKHLRLRYKIYNDVIN